MSVKALLEKESIPFTEGRTFADLTTLGVGGEISLLVHLTTFRTAGRVLSLLDERGLPWFILGKGANLVVSDDPFPGVVLSLRGIFSETWIRGDRLISGGGVHLNMLIGRMVGEGLGGMELMAGFPSTIGGAVVMNAGSYGQTIKDSLECVLLATPTGVIRKISREAITFGYRTTSLQGEGIVLMAVLRGVPRDGAHLEAERRRVIETRRISLPPGRHAGSIFKNPPGRKAWELIRSCFPQGSREGGAMISEKHANVIINEGNAAGKDVYTLIGRIRSAVEEKHGITLDPEVKLIGFPPL